MQATDIRQHLIDRLIGLNKKNKYLLSAETTNVDWGNLKVDIQQNLDKLKKSAKVYEILAYIMMAVTGVLALIKLFSDNGGPDLNKGSLFIFLTVSIMFSAFSQRLQVERLEKQILLLDILENTDEQK